MIPCVKSSCGAWINEIDFEMKSYCLFIFSIIFSFPVISQNRFKAGIKAGISTCQVAGDTYSGFNKAGMVAGGFVKTKLNENWGVQFEILYIQKGSKHNSNPDVGDYTFYLMKLNYLEVPLLFQYRNKKFSFEVGPGVGYLTSAKEYDTYGDITGLRPFNTTEVSFNVGISYNLFKNLDINWRYNNSLNAIREHASGATFWWNPGQQNNVLAFTLSYWFGKNENTSTDNK